MDLGEYKHIVILIAALAAFGIVAWEWWRASSNTRRPDQDSHDE